MSASPASRISLGTTISSLMTVIVHQLCTDMSTSFSLICQACTIVKVGVCHMFKNAYWNLICLPEINSAHTGNVASVTRPFSPIFEGVGPGNEASQFCLSLALRVRERARVSSFLALRMGGSDGTFMVI